MVFPEERNLISSTVIIFRIIRKIYSVAGQTKAEFAYDALGRRIEKKDLVDPNNTRRYYYNYNWHALCQYDGSGAIKEIFVYGNYIDEVLYKVPFFFYIHDHLYSPVALVHWLGSVLERYEYDAYGNCYVLEPNFATDPDGKSDYGNPFYFTGREMDIFDSGNLKLYNYRHRYYDSYTGRFTTHDPLGIIPDPEKPNLFIPVGQYKDGMNLYEYVGSTPNRVTDPFGLESSDCGPFCDCNPRLFDEESIPGCSSGGWDPIRAAIHFIFGGGWPKIFCPDSSFTQRIANDTRFINSTIRQTFGWLEEKVRTHAVSMTPNTCKQAEIVGWGAPYQFGHDWLLENTIGSGGGGPDPLSHFTYNAKCCLKKPCCDIGLINVRIRCKVKFRLSDTYSLNFDPFGRRIGTPFRTIVYFYKDFGPKKMCVSCD